MRITQISLINFRSFKETQTIYIAPLTLLFGPNSVGKSSVLMALAYVQQILKHGHCNSQKLDSLGKKNNRWFDGYEQADKPIVYLDESGFAQSMPRLHGYSKKGYGASVHTIGTRKAV
ncbi:hypothetical protein XBO1_2450018 [Xenorhabdus bovienii str. oregonense]|uniref:Endonuclease GajA/Old nuclease/RecF-like AAA domain-containing protein n=1 Tax=Xenorhabdus bovienii str. oregonense TaxID=1398202 RepID=A0A077P6P1_XENBV|nr:AAA family ATPase [Xenorhabdus bovienii]CDH06795.1 hypothetical protein XBO1_2450018 [Xenorhabdus bovienii str. oregonense]